MTRKSIKMILENIPHCKTIIIYLKDGGRILYNSECGLKINCMNNSFSIDGDLIDVLISYDSVDRIE